MGAQFDQRIDAMNERFDTMNERFDQMQQQFDQRLDSMGAQFDQRLDKVNERLDRMNEQMRVQTRWTIGTIALIGVILSALLAIGQFVA
jgi:DNA anti-recombination protein RmuC